MHDVISDVSCKGQIPLRYPARELVRELDSVMEFGLKQDGFYKVTTKTVNISLTSLLQV